MSGDEPLLSKMDALLRKHRGDGDATTAAVPPAALAAASAPPPAWLPVLTQVIERGSLPEPASGPAAPAVSPVTDAVEPAPAPGPVSNEALADQLMRELAPRLSEVMEKQVAPATIMAVDVDRSYFHGRTPIVM